MSRNARGVIAVFAEVPLAGRCLAPLVPYNDEAWLARLYAAMLRDTLDGLEAVPAARYLVVNDDADRAVLARHIPAPWELASTSDLDPNAFMIYANPLAPAATIEPLFDVVNDERAVIGASASGDLWLAGGDAIRAECTNALFLPEAIVVGSHAAMEALFEELRRHHERAPRTATVAMTS